MSAQLQDLNAKQHLARVLFACIATGLVGAMSYLTLNLLIAR
jgi:hypothetical protein